MQISVEITNVIVDPEFNAAEIIITPIFSSGEGSTGIQSVSKNGTPIIPIGGNVDITVPTKTSDLTNDSDFVSDANYVHTDNNYDNASALEVAKIVEKANSSDVYTKSETFSQTEINNKLSAVYKYKFSVDYYSELPLVRENGDTYNVRFNDDDTPSGANYAWSNELNDWDSLGGLIGLATLTENGLLSKEDFALLRNLYTSDEIDQLLLGFAKISGGNTFADTQNFDGRINHKVGEYFYTAASKTADTVNDTRVINTAGVEIHSICTVLGATKGGGTWAILYRITSDGIFTIGSGGANVPDNRWKFYNSGFSMFNGRITFVNDGEVYSGNGALRLGTFGSEYVRIDAIGNINHSIGKYKYSAASPTADTINDTRTVNTSGLWELFKCSLGNTTKGLGTWIYGRLKLGMVIETEINEYTDNAAALAAGLTAGMKYRTGDLYKIVH